MPDEGFNRPYTGRPYEDPYNYGDTARGVKRPYFAVLIIFSLIYFMLD